MTDTPTPPAEATDGRLPARACSWVGMFSRAQLDDLRIVMLQSERRWDENQADEWASTEMPFGKYIGQDLGDIPLKYLDETIAVMPQTWFVRIVVKFIDLVMEHGSLGGVCPNRVPNISYRQMMAEWEIELASMNAAADSVNPTNVE